MTDGDAPASAAPVVAGVTGHVDGRGSGAERRTTRRRARQPRRRAVVVGAAAALAVAAAVLVGVLIARPSPEPAFSQPVALQPVEGTTASGTAALRTSDTGTVVRLDLEGLPGEAGTWFECVWTGSQGPRSAGTFRATRDGSARVELTTAAASYGHWELQVVEHPPGAAEGTALLTAQA